MKSILSLLLTCAGTLSAAVSLPYSNDFSSSAADFTTGGSNSTWVLGGGSYTNTITADGPSFAVVEATGLGGGTKQAFSVSTVITSASGSSGTVGFGLLATGTNLATSSFILADLFNNGNLRFRSFTNGAPTGSDSSAATAIRLFNIATDGPITLTVTGIYNPDSSLTLTLTATQGAVTASHSTTYSGAALIDGSYFGYRDRNNTGSTTVVTMTSVHDSFSLQAIPEPSAALLAGVPVLLLGLRRRRDAR